MNLGLVPFWGPIRGGLFRSPPVSFVNKVAAPKPEVARTSGDHAHSGLEIMYLFLARAMYGIRGSGWSPPPMGFYLGILIKWSPP